MKLLWNSVAALLIFVAFSAWGAERRKPASPLAPPEFPYSPFGFNRGDEKRGEALYRQNGCDSCHLIGGKGGKIGPDLSRVGEARRVPEAYRQYLTAEHRPRVTLHDRDMDDLIEYLQSLKLLR
jgi:cytochrome c2